MSAPERARRVRKGERYVSDGIESKVLLVVAGPSGSGKTVFINQFRAGTLAPELKALLPENAERWPQIGANDCMKRDVPLARVLPKVWTAPGGIVHYDTAYIHRFGLGSYHDDPGSELFRRAGRTVVVSIAPSAEQLQGQFEARQAQHRSSKKRSHLLWRDFVRAPVERLFHRLQGVDPHQTGELYEDPDWLSRCYREWDEFVRGIAGTKPGSHLITLEPYIDEKKGPSFRLVEAR